MMRFFPVLLFAVLLALAACGSTGAAIGSTVKGKRVAVMDQAKTIEADKSLQGEKPQLTAPVDVVNWAQAGHDPLHVLPNAKLSAHPQVAWSANIGAGSDSDFKLLAQPMIANGIVFTMDAQGQVSAFNALTGDRKWYVDTTPENSDVKAIGGGLGADNDTIYATTGFGEVLALDVIDGHIKWRRSLQNPVRAAPTVANNRIYAVTIDNQLSALDARTGEILWHHNGIVESATLMGASNPAVEGDSAVVAYSSGEIYNLRVENGRVSWNYALTTPTQVGALPAIADIRGLPVIDHGHVFAISHSGRIASIDHRTGDREWEADVGGVNTPVVSGDTIFVLNNERQLVALSRASGRIIWIQDLQKLSDPTDHDSDPLFWSGPVMGQDRLWLANSLGQIVSFSPNNGKQLTTVTLDAPVYVTPVIAGHTMYVVTDDGYLVALR